MRPRPRSPPEMRNGVCSNGSAVWDVPNHPITMATNPPRSATPPPIIRKRSTIWSLRDRKRSLLTPSVKRSSDLMRSLLLQWTSIRRARDEGTIGQHLQDPAGAGRREQREGRKHHRHRLHGRDVDRKARRHGGHRAAARPRRLRQVDGPATPARCRRGGGRGGAPASSSPTARRWWRWWWDREGVAADRLRADAHATDRHRHLLVELHVGLQLVLDLLRELADDRIERVRLEREHEPSQHALRVGALHRVDR